jgi:predicted nucleotidyltransferase
MKDRPVKPVQEDVLETMTRRLVAEFDPEEIILFGSQAWGTPDGDSDVDLLVIVSDSDLPPSRRAQKAHRCLGGLGVSKDVLVKTRGEVERSRHVRTSLVSQILERGRVLHARSPA